MLLLVVEDRHAEDDLRRALASARGRGAAAMVLTGDALFAMRLRREGVDARLTVESAPLEARRETFERRDAQALDGVGKAFGRRAEVLGTRFGPYLQYTLIPAFIRAVRNVTAMDDVLTAHAAAPGSDADIRIGLVGGGPLVDAARLFASRRGIAVETFGGDVFTRAMQAIGRMNAGRATKWVNTDLRALLLEPGFIWLLYLKGLWRRIAGPAPPAAAHRAIIVVGDRFTADVVGRLQGESRPLIVAGATQPGRALFDGRTMAGASGRFAQPQPIEAFTELADPLRWIAAVLDATAEAMALAGDEAHGRQFVVAGVPYWPLVGRTVWLHVLSWIPALRHLQTLAARAARACPDAQLLTSTDVTAYNRVLIDTARAFGVASTGIQHGITGEPNGHSVVHVDRLATWGDSTEPWYRERAPQTAAFVVTGNPRFDGLAVRVAQSTPLDGTGPADALPHAIRIPNPEARRPFTVTVCTGFMSDFSVGATEHENLLMLDAVLAWARTRDRVRVIHKMHPGEEPAYYTQAARALGWDPLMLTTIREPILYDVLEQSDVLVAAYSTTVLESIALGTRAIVFDGIVQRKLLPLDRIPGLGIAYSVEDLQRQLDAAAAAAPPDRAALRGSAELRAYISELDGGATARVAALVFDGASGHV
jgi:hypothetical protein